MFSDSFLFVFFLYSLQLLEINPPIGLYGNYSVLWNGKLAQQVSVGFLYVGHIVSAVQTEPAAG